MHPLDGRFRLIAPALMLAVLSACSTAANGSPGASSSGAVALAKDQTLRLSVGRPPRTLDPGVSGQTLFSHLVAEPLLTMNPDSTDVVGAAAESFEVSHDGLTYTFHLRPDGAYNDGRPVTAQDFVFAWRRLIDPRVGAPNEMVFANDVKGAKDVAALDPKSAGSQIDTALGALGLKAGDAHTFTVTLGRPDAAFKWIATLVDGSPLRQDVVEQSGWATTPQTLVTNGVFRLSSLNQGQSCTFAPNTHYRAQPKLQTIVVEVAQASTEWTKYQNDEADIAYPPEAQLHAVSTDPTLSKQIVHDPQPSVEWTTFNTTKAPFDNPKVRQAFTEAVDRQAYVQALLPDGEAEPFTTLLPKGMLGYDSSLTGAQQFDAAKAKADLAASGVAPAQLQGLHILTGSYFVSQTEFLVSQIKQNLGIDLTIDSVGDFSTILDQVGRGDFSIYDLDYVNAPYPDPSSILDNFVSTSPMNNPRWKDSQYDALVQRADTTSDVTQRLQLYHTAEQLLLLQAPISMLYQFYNNIWFKPWVRGVVTSPFDDTAFPGDLHLTSIYIAPH